MNIARIAGLGAAAALALAISACAGAKPSLVAERPKAEEFRTSLPRELSTVNVAVEATSDELATALNRMIGKNLYKGTTTQGLTVEALKNGAIAVSATGGYVYVTVPVSLRLSYGMFETPALTSRLQFRLNARVNPDWTIGTDIYYMGLADQLVDELRVGPISIKPRTVVEGITQPVQKVVSDAAARKINEAFPLKTQVARGWRALQKPMPVDAKHSAWLQITPQEVMLCPLVAQDNRLRISLGITCFAEVVVGPEPAPRPPVPLPNLKVAAAFDRRFRIALNADLHYSDLLSIASPLLLDREFDSDGKKVRLREFDLYGNGEKLVVKVATVGALDGTFYLTCRPGVDAETKAFSVREVDFDMQTQSLLLQSADWFLHGTIRSMIQEKLNMDLTQRLVQARDLAQNALREVRLAENVILRGNVSSIRLADALVQKDRLSIRLLAEGETTVVLQ